ncbi:NAD-dependent epimerase/dehydratase family protein [Pusillimonas minor]|uniref:NAD-dependent epimerase/dehydratase family protein n=1 Tax=Pusillimonas minor TaxID=2697024 RepID=A0A842HQD7_9BURK|nr:NAD-dependent epimerase/dehydratase family protein [Pusillimonas minor]MBC2769838.1 NAD-dependent epimerase/dehydratase family protein [Pusillimonas minor]
MKVLVTGGAGFIGSWLDESLIEAGHEVIVIDNLSPQTHGALRQSNIPWLKTGDVEFLCADVRNRSVMDIALARMEEIVHLAAETCTGQSMYQIAHYYAVNQQATAALFEANGACHRHISRIILASSRTIYGEGAYRLGKQLFVPTSRDTSRMKAGDFEPYGPSVEMLKLVATPEHVTPRPASVYAATKLANETFSRIFAKVYGTTVVALRFQDIYGERQSLHNPCTGILSILSNRMRQGLPINIIEDGREGRDFVHVSDVVRAICLGLDKTLTGFDALNMGSGLPTNVNEVAQLLQQPLGSESALHVTGDFRAGDIRHCYANLSRARALGAGTGA